MQLEWPEPLELNLVHIVFQTSSLAPESFELALTGADGSERHIPVSGNRLRRVVLGFTLQKISRARIIIPGPSGICEIRAYRGTEEEASTARRVLQNTAAPDTPPYFPWEKSGKSTN